MSCFLASRPHERPYVQYHEIRGYAGTGGGWQEDWVVGNRLDEAYNAGYRIPYSSNDDADTTVSRLFDAFGRVSHRRPPGFE